jgi:hypothetical protein
VVAVSGEEVIDVTQRYTHKWTEVLTRRTDCAEDWLATMITGMNAVKLSKLTSDRRAVLAERAKVEQAEFKRNRELDPEAKAAMIKEEEKIGRLTGSVEWRSARGELGDTNRPLPSDAVTAMTPPTASTTDPAKITSSPVEEKKRPWTTTTPASIPTPPTNECGDAKSTNGVVAVPGSCTVPAADSTMPPTPTKVIPTAVAATTVLSSQAQKAQLQAAAKATILK